MNKLLKILFALGLLVAVTGCVHYHGRHYGSPNGYSGGGYRQSYDGYSGYRRPYYGPSHFRPHWGGHHRHHDW